MPRRCFSSVGYDGKEDAGGDDEEHSRANEGNRSRADGRALAMGGLCRRWVPRTIEKRLQGPDIRRFSTGFRFIGDWGLPNAGHSAYIQLIENLPKI